MLTPRILIPSLLRSLFLAAMLSSGLPAESPPATANELPVYVAANPNINDYTLFANSGWDGNWYVGYNTCWIKKLPPIPPGNYSHAYIGAKLGRMKLLNNSFESDRRPVPGMIYMAIASTSAWTRDHSYALT